MPRIASFQTFGDTAVPISTEGRYLRWDTPSDKEAPALCGPHGPLYFGVGDVDVRVYIDWVEMPSDFFLVEIGGRTDLLTLGHHYVIFKKDEVLVELWKMTEQIMKDLAKNGVEHSFALWNADEFYAWRSLAAEIGKTPWALMDPFEHRFSDTL